jgi:hypothetical protein
MLRRVALVRTTRRNIPEDGILQLSLFRVCKIHGLYFTGSVRLIKDRGYSCTYRDEMDTAVREELRGCVLGSMPTQCLRTDDTLDATDDAGRTEEQTQRLRRVSDVTGTVERM